ncbi:DUF983 domain-containing protein [Polaribacter irgensii]|nr:DUF983 domain-containing protein [Polaribacter irgensii]
MMFKKGTKMYSIANSKCPRCQEGAFFKHSFTFHPAKITQLHENCSKCNLRYMMEPSFFFGAMYVNYGITVALSIATFTIATLLFNLILLESFAAIIGVLLILAPLNLRLSRIIWINMFVSYKEK